MTFDKEITPLRGDAAGTDIPSESSIRSLDSRDLLAGGREIMIRHGDSTYRLRATNKGKLILTK